MKFSVLLSSYNRPTLIQQAIKSVVSQTHSNLELLILDDGSTFDIDSLLTQYTDSRIKLYKFNPTCQERKTCLRMCKLINFGLENITGDIVTYLADDDYYETTWLAKVDTFFTLNPTSTIVYGILKYVGTHTGIRFPNTITTGIGELDHNQFAHKKDCLLSLEKPYWPEDLLSFNWPDGAFINKLLQKFKIDLLPTISAYKRVHNKGLLYNEAKYLDGTISGLRE